MNQENLNKVFENYIQKFDLMNDSKHNETYKWVAVSHFQKHWDIDADDFSAMFKLAVKETYNLINNSRVSPTSGIVQLAKHDMNAARESLRMLYKEDNGDLDARQERIETFVASVNELLDKYEPGKWKYAQDVRAAITYLNLRYPKENYLYKATVSSSFAACVEFGDDIGGGQSFKLRKYYAMCDMLVAAMKENNELIAIHDSRSPELREICGYNMLAYDVIYCADQYNLYDTIPVKIKKRKTQANIADDSGMENRAILQIKVEDLNARLVALEQDKKTYDGGSLRNMSVKHKTFGLGVVKAYHGNTLEVQFPEGSRKFSLPSAFSSGFLTPDDPSITEWFISYAEIEKQEADLRALLSAVKFELGKC